MPPLDLSRTEWDLSPLLASDTDSRLPELRAEVSRANRAFVEAWKDRSDYLREPAVLRQALDQYESLQRGFGTSGGFGYYFDLRNAQNQQSPVVKAEEKKSEDLGVELANALQFFELQLAKIAPERQAAFLTAAELEPYRHFLERLFASAAYQLSEPEERILNLKYSTARGNWVKLTAGLLSAEEREVLLEDGSRAAVPFEQVMSLTSSHSKEVRDAAARTFNEILSRHLDVAEAELNSVLADKEVDDKLRALPRPDASRHLSDDIASGTVDAMVEAVSGRFDISQRYYRLKARLLGQEKLAYHERAVEYGTVSKEYSYEDAMELVHRVLGQLDPRFAEFVELFAAGSVDVYPRTGKRGGAFCSHNLITQPTYVLLNHTGRLRDVLTIAHEFGHGINNELIREGQNALNFGTPTSTAEVASTFMEDFVLDELLREAGDELRLSLLMMKLDGDVATIFRQVACYRFEQELHASFRAAGFLPKEEIGRLFLSHMGAYMGDAVSLDAGSQNWWTYWSHIRSFFYVYSYASGLLISKSLQAMVKKEAGTIERVKGFLAAGLSQSPQAIFASLDIDIDNPAFWQGGLAQVEALLQEAEELAARLGT